MATTIIIAFIWKRGMGNTLDGPTSRVQLTSGLETLSFSALVVHYDT
jgi:hypothetical protein